MENYTSQELIVGFIILGVVVELACLALGFSLLKVLGRLFFGKGKK